MNISYIEAKKNKDLRQKFLEQYLKFNPSKAVSRLVYDKDLRDLISFIDKKISLGQASEEDKNNLLNSFKDDDNLDMESLAFVVRNSIGGGRASKIFVTPACFDFSEKDFDCILKGHEYVHAEHVLNGLNFKFGGSYTYLLYETYSSETILLLDESIAYINTLKMALQINNFSKLIENCKENLENITKQLQELKTFKSGTEEDVVKKQIIENLKILKDYLTISSKKLN